MMVFHRIPLIYPVFLVLLLGGAACSGKGDEEEGDEVVAIAPVVVVRAYEGTLASKETVFGTVIPAPGAVRTFSVPFESRIRTIQVVRGQQVGAGQRLLSLTPSGAAQTQIEQARVTYQTEQTRLEAARQRFNLGLATREDLAAQEQAAENARAAYQNLSQWARQGVITTVQAGAIDSIYVYQGALVPAGTPLIDVALGGRNEVRLGVEPAVASGLRPGQAVVLHPLYRADSASVRGSVRSIARRIDPQTRLVEVLVDPMSSADLLQDGFVSADLTASSTRGVIVPRTAVTSEEDHYVLFTVSGGKAHRHLVEVSLETDREVLVRGDVSQGDSVVVQGNYELSDGMRVRVERTRSTR